MITYIRKAPIPFFSQIFDTMEEVFQEFADEFKEKIKNTTDESKDTENTESNEKTMQINEDEVLNYFKPLVEFSISLKLVSERPLYHEAVVSSVTAFETYLKRTLVESVSRFPEIEKRFTPELKKEVSYEKISNMDYERDKALGYIVASTVNFYDMNKINEIFKRAFGIRNKEWSLFSSKKAKKDMQKFMEIRHLIVHNGGFVDSKFKKKINCKENINEEYPLEREYIEEMMDEMLYVTSKIEKEIKRIVTKDMASI